MRTGTGQGWRGRAQVRPAPGAAHPTCPIMAATTISSKAITVILTTQWEQGRRGQVHGVWEAPCRSRG